MGDVISGVVNGVEQAVGGVAQGVGSLLSNPTVDTIAGSLIGMPELRLFGRYFWWSDAGWRRFTRRRRGTSGRSWRNPRWTAGYQQRVPWFLGWDHQ